MTAIKYHAIYATSDREAARQYRIHSSKRTQRMHPTYRLKHEGEITETERQALLEHKAISEARQTLHS